MALFVSFQMQSLKESLVLTEATRANVYTYKRTINGPPFWNWVYVIGLVCFFQAFFATAEVAKITVMISFTLKFSLFTCLLNDIFYVAFARWSKWLTAQFLVQLYLAQPRVMRSIKDFRSLTTSGAISQSSRCQVCVTLPFHLFS